MAARREGGENLRQPAISRVSPDPPRTRQARDTYETGNSQVRAWGRLRLSISRLLMTLGWGWAGRGARRGRMGRLPRSHWHPCPEAHGSGQPLQSEAPYAQNAGKGPIWRVCAGAVNTIYGASRPLPFPIPKTARLLLQADRDTGGAGTGRKSGLRASDNVYPRSERWRPRRLKPWAFWLENRLSRCSQGPKPAWTPALRDFVARPARPVGRAHFNLASGYSAPRISDMKAGLTMTHGSLAAV